jgi:hypothetical protein
MKTLASRALLLCAVLMPIFPIPSALAAGVKKLTYSTLFGRCQLYLGKGCFRADCFWGSAILNSHHILYVCNSDSEKFIAYKDPKEFAKSPLFAQSRGHIKQISNWKRVGSESIQGFKADKYVRTCSRLQNAVGGGKAIWTEYQETIWTKSFAEIPPDWVGPCAAAIGCETPGATPLRKEFSNLSRPLIACVKSETVMTPDGFFQVPVSYSKAQDIFEVMMDSSAFVEPSHKGRPD